jgi:3-dehydroquinate dehydratase
MLAAGARAILCGFGAQGYELALRGLAATAPRQASSGRG